MSKSYKIINHINDKVYIGKTKLSIEKRFKQHYEDSKKRNKENRPLYKAINKYGINHFSIQLIEECSEEIASDREKYWIDFYKGYTNGYNATLGGDGKAYIDISILLNLWEKGYSIKQISRETNHDVNWISLLLQENGVSKNDIIERGKNISFQLTSKNVLMLDKHTKQVIKKFSSTREAARFLINKKGLKPCNESGYSGHISEVCRGKRKSCLGYIWKYENN